MVSEQPDFCLHGDAWCFWRPVAPVQKNTKTKSHLAFWSWDPVHRAGTPLEHLVSDHQTSMDQLIRPVFRRALLFAPRPVLSRYRCLGLPQMVFPVQGYRDERDLRVHGHAAFRFSPFGRYFCRGISEPARFLERPYSGAGRIFGDLVDSLLDVQETNLHQDIATGFSFLKIGR